MNQKMIKGAGIAAVAMASLMATPSLAGGIVPTLTVSGNKSNVAYGESVTMTTTFTGGGYACGGSVEVQPLPLPSAVACSAPVVADGSVVGGFKSVCTVSSSALGAGAHELRARYVSDGNAQCYGTTSTTNFMLTVANPTPVPTTSEWTLWGMMGLLLIGGGVFASRRFRATSA